MTYNPQQYARQAPAPAQHQNGTRATFQQRTYQPQPGYYFPSQPGQQFIPVQPQLQHFQMMPYAQPQAQPQTPVFLTEDNFNQMAQMAALQQQPIRFPPQPQQQPAYPDTRRKKKEQPVAPNPTPQYQPMPPVPQQVTIPTQIQPPKRAIQQAYQPQAIQPNPIPPPPKQQQIHQIQQPVPPPTLQQPAHPPPPIYAQQQSQSGLDQLNSKAAMPVTFSNGKTPGCFNIIRRGNLPGMIFSQVLVSPIV